MTLFFPLETLLPFTVKTKLALAQFFEAALEFCYNSECKIQVK